MLLKIARCSCGWCSGIMHVSLMSRYFHHFLNVLITRRILVDVYNILQPLTPPYHAHTRSDMLLHEHKMHLSKLPVHFFLLFFFKFDHLHCKSTIVWFGVTVQMAKSASPLVEWSHSVSFIFRGAGALATALLKASHFHSDGIVLSYLQCKTAYASLSLSLSPLCREMAEGPASPPGSTGMSSLNRRPCMLLSWHTWALASSPCLATSETSFEPWA